MYGLYWWKYDQYMVCDGPTCKGKETLTFAGGGSEGQKIMYTGLALPTYVQKKGGALILGLCA